MALRLVILFLLTFQLTITGIAGTNPLAHASARVAPADAATNVTWTGLVNCQASGGILQKTSGCDGCPDARASSRESILAGDGYLQFTANNNNTDRYCGLSYSGNSPNYATIDFAFHLSASGYLEVREDNAYRTDARYSAGDVLKVSIEAGNVNYYRNGQLFYRSGKAPVYPVAAAASLLTRNSAIAAAAGVFNSSPALSILSQSSSNVTTTSASITWTTNLASDSLVQYGLTTSYGAATSLDPTMTTSHSVTLSGLQPGTTYNYRVVSHDSLGNTAVSSNQVFATLQQAATPGQPTLPA